MIVISCFLDEPNMRQLTEMLKFHFLPYYFSSFLCLHLLLENVSFPKHTWKTHLLSELGEILLGWPKSSLGFFSKTLWENPSKLFDQPNTFTECSEKYFNCYWIQKVFHLVRLFIVERLDLWALLGVGLCTPQILMYKSYPQYFRI